MRAERLAELEALGRELLTGPYSADPSGPEDGISIVGPDEGLSRHWLVTAYTPREAEFLASLLTLAPELIALARAALEWREADAAFRAAGTKREADRLFIVLKAAEARLRGGKNA